MTLTTVLDAYILTLTTVKAATRTRYRYHAREAVRHYGRGDARWNRVDYATLVANIPAEDASTLSVVRRTLAWMGV